MKMAQPASQFGQPVRRSTVGVLHRATIAPVVLSPNSRTLENRAVFFEAPMGEDPRRHLEQLLARAWCTDVNLWRGRALLHDLISADALVERARGAASTGDLRLLEADWSRPDGERSAPHAALRYLRSPGVELLTTPGVSGRLRRLLETVDRMPLLG